VTRSALRKTLLGMARVLPLRLIPLDALLRLAQRTTSAVAGALYLRDWLLEARGRPQFFKHQINLARWPLEPARWAFAARGVYARQAMFKGSKVLDLCCGDGSVSYLFFSDIAGQVDAVDNDAYAIAYARRYFPSPVVKYHQVDILSSEFPSSDYDFVVWNAAICYFREAEIRCILRKIAAAGKQSMRMTGMLPRANRWVDHKTEFEDRAAVEKLLLEYFAAVEVREVDEGTALTFYFQAASPLPAYKRDAA
jgi:SAM-dependent methyltransferase